MCTAQATSAPKRCCASLKLPRILVQYRPCFHPRNCFSLVRRQGPSSGNCRQNNRSWRGARRHMSFQLFWYRSVPRLKQTGRRDGMGRGPGGSSTLWKFVSLKVLGPEHLDSKRPTSSTWTDRSCGTYRPERGASLLSHHLASRGGLCMPSRVSINERSATQFIAP